MLLIVLFFYGEVLLMNIYVGNIPHATTEDALKKAFEQFGKVESVKIVFDRETNRSRGFGFVVMENTAEAEEAIAKMNGAEFEGRTLNVNEARPREERAPRSFGDRGPRRPGNGGGGGFRGNRNF